MTLYVVKYRSDLYVTIIGSHYFLTGDASDSFASFNPPHFEDLCAIADDLRKVVSDFDVVEWKIEESVYHE